MNKYIEQHCSVSSSPGDSARSSDSEPHFLNAVALLFGMKTDQETTAATRRETAYASHFPALFLYETFAYSFPIAKAN